MSFYNKYLKYKTKYIDLKYKLIGGSPFGIDASPTAAYIYTRDAAGVFYIGFVRKLYNDGRRRLDPTKSTGSAGTLPKFWGKWTNIGGSRTAGKHHLEAIIEELNEETNALPLFRSDHVDITRIHRTARLLPGRVYNIIARGMHRDPATGSMIFILEIPSPAIFFNVFPKAGITNPAILTTSGGEIDATQSYNMEQIVALQAANANNYFIYYCINNLNTYLKPHLCGKSVAFNAKWGAVLIPHNDNGISRMPAELVHAPYTEIAGRKYV
jgi:hypothetical protein